MTSWADVVAAAPSLAAAVEARFAATGLGFLATIRRDGSPRISGIEPWIADGELCLGMMPASRKADDVVRDPRMALHAASVDKDVKEGDAKVAGRCVPVDDPVRFAALVSALRPEHEDAPDEPFPLFTVDVAEVVLTRPEGDVLVVESWSPAQGLRRVERR